MSDSKSVAKDNRSTMGEKMERHEIINKIESILEDARTGIMATSDLEGRVHLRWMTPAVLKYQPDAIYCFAVPGSEKLKHINANNKVEWMIQTRDLREIVNIQGAVNIIDTPATKSELLEALGARLATFWKVNVDAEEFVVLETKIHSATYYKPMKAIQEIVIFPEVQDSGT
ncbi:MAG TPA: pyridoxamine 5'-phosphate oxidase family protein [Phycisphaerales bacterium]|nr:pyridoxamine 5'-phosphate oxidase family protein [Phycisphaerales bacterium]